MKVFTGFQEKDKKTNRKFAWMFFVPFIFSLLFAFSTPQKDELKVLKGSLKNYKCKTQTRSKADIVEIELTEDAGDVFEFSFRGECKNNLVVPIPGTKLQVLYDLPMFGSTVNVYEVLLGECIILSYDRSRNNRIMMPFGAVLVFGLPWLIWACATVVRS